MTREQMKEYLLSEIKKVVATGKKLEREELDHLAVDLFRRLSDKYDGPLLWEALGDLCHDMAEQERAKQLDVPVALSLMDFHNATRSPLQPSPLTPPEKASLNHVRKLKREIYDLMRKLIPPGKGHAGGRGQKISQRLAHAIEINLVWKYGSLYSVPTNLTIGNLAEMLKTVDILKVSGAGRMTADAWEKVRNHVRYN